MLVSADGFAIVLIALCVDAVIGDPDVIWRRFPHPVAGMGALIGALDRRFNREETLPMRRRLLGVGALAVMLAVAIACGVAIDRALRALPGHPWTIGAVASILIAQQSLYRHVARVRNALGAGLAQGRCAVSMIVGRNPESLDEAGVCRAAIESTAEGFCDGVVAPAFWLAIFGLPGLIAYKMVNTADSMIGHRTPRHEAFGWASARLDDWLNLVPARLSGVLLALAAPVAGGNPAIAFRVMLRDAKLHRSPNAGWPESAMAAALGVSLAGPRRYGDRIVDDPFLHQEGRPATPDDIMAGLRVFLAGCALQAALFLLAAST